MKKSIISLLSAAFLAVGLVGCEDELLPTAGFSYEPAEVTAYQEISFTNTSSDADTYSWDFGDESTSTDMDPTHVYTAAGTYTVKLVATNADGENTYEEDIVVGEWVNSYMIDEVEFIVDSDMFWYQSPMGGDPYIRLITEVDGQENPDLLKLYPNKGLSELPGTYTWDPENPAGTYDVGYTGGYAGLQYDWTAIGKTGSGDLVISMIDNLYRVTGSFVLSVGTYNYSTGEFTETGTKNLTLDYIGDITPLP